LERLPEEGAAILLAHEPDFADLSARTGRFDLQLSGHSHGGQVKLPLFGIPYLPRFARKYPRGRYQVGKMILYTNRGLGMVHLPFRFNSRPEITLFTLNGPKNC
jgi:predicted MPP superfamily phosphohydrolase